MRNIKYNMGTVVQQTTRPYSGQWTLPQRSSEPLSPPSWTFSLHDAPAKPTVSWRTPPTPPTVSSSSYHQEDVPEHQSPLRQTAQQNCPEPKSKPPPQPYHIKGKNCLRLFFVLFKVCYTQVSGPVPTTCRNTLSSICTRHFSHTAVCTQSQKRLNNICMFTCSCTTNHLVLFPSQLLDSQCFSLHMYSIYVKHSYSLYSLYFLVYV